MTQTFTVGGKVVELEVLLFDSVVMVGNTDVFNPDGTVSEVPLSALEDQDTPLARQQLQWLTERVANSTADYLWVGGHYRESLNTHARNTHTHIYI